MFIFRNIFLEELKGFKNKFSSVSLTVMLYTSSKLVINF